VTARTGVFVVIAFNVLYIAGLAGLPFLLGDLRPPDFTVIRATIERSPSVEDLRPRALHAVSALEHADRAVSNSHTVTVRLVRVGVIWATVNSVVVYLLARELSRRGEQV
jgi:hypothetical protein